MKKYFLFLLGLVVANIACAVVPEFIKEGNVYSFLFAGRSDLPDSSLAKVEKIDPAGWLEITLVKKGERMWINLAQVQVVIPSKFEAAIVREKLIRSKVAENLRTIAQKVEMFRLEQGKEPSSVAEAFGGANDYIPLEIQDGEDYSILDIAGDKPLTIKTKSGYEISFAREIHAVTSSNPSPPPPARSLPHPRLAQVRPGILQERPVGVSNAGHIGVDAHFSQFGDYLQELIDIVDIRWERIISSSSVYPKASSHVTISFRINSKGQIAEILKVEGDAGEYGSNAALSAIREPAPYRAWTKEMVAVLGDDQVITFAFYYW